MKYIFVLFLLIIINATDTNLKSSNINYTSVQCFLNAKKHYINPPKIILITIDGVRQEDIFDKHVGVGSYRPTSRELVPNIYERFVDNGIAIGNHSPAFVGGPSHISMPGYLEIMGGYPSLDCFSNYCQRNNKPTLIDEFPNNSAIFAGWDTISKVFNNNLAIVNIGKKIRNKQWNVLNLPENNDLSDDFEDEEYRADKYTEEAVLLYLAKYKQPNFMWISLGDTDEFAHMNNMLFYWISLNSADEFIGKILKLAEPNTVFIICPDHGRAKNFRDHGLDSESGKVWIMIGGSNIPKIGFVKYNHDVYLSNIYPTIMEITKNIKSDKSLFNYSP